ncbi:MAG: AAA family ATPase [Acidobacteria bacterium]|nr:AAA family ATPase [Acidobacteriota bacterium]
MSEKGVSRIESVSREDLESRLREIARLHHPEEILDRLELAHLVQVLTNDALLLGDLYTRTALGQILDREIPTLPQALRALAERADRQGHEDTSLLTEVRRLPEDIKAVGDKCLLDVGLIGQREFQGISLIDLGRRSYEVASRIMERLAADATLSRFFKENQIAALPIEEEVLFLQQCSRRFALYADLLHWLRADNPERREDRALAGTQPATLTPGPGAGVIATMTGVTMTDEAVSEGEDGRPLPFPPARPQPAGERVQLPRDELLAAYERILLFSALDIPALGERLGETVVGQRGAIQSLCDEFTLYATGTHNLSRPPSYLFVGPTGVGKNYLMETLLEILEQGWGLEIPVLTLEGPNYTYPSDINELRGATRGFIRSDEEGVLSEFHKTAATSPLSVILIDEVEKAHPQLRRFFLSIMDRGTVTDNKGKVLSFANSMLVFTSNIGYSDLKRQAAPIGYGDQDSQDRREAQDVRRALRRTLSPEFINRLRPIHFDHLGPESLERIFDLELERIARRFRDIHDLEIEVTPAARTELLRQGTSHDHGARHLRARMETLINVEISRRIKADERRKRSGHTRTLTYLRALKTGERAFDLEEVRARVMKVARARVSYHRFRVDLKDDGFLYEGVAESL